MATWVSLLHLTLGAAILAFAAWFWALARGGIARIAVLQFVQPIISVLLAALLLGEPLTPGLLIVGAIILAGVIIAQRA